VFYNLILPVGGQYKDEGLRCRLAFLVVEFGKTRFKLFETCSYGTTVLPSPFIILALIHETGRTRTGGCAVVKVETVDAGRVVVDNK
jgi:hypothetical protein